jgi:hypothetical protein
MLIPIFVDLNNLPDLEFDGFGEFLIAVLIGSFGLIPLTYSIIGVINGFDMIGIYWVSGYIGFLSSMLIAFIASFFVD